MKPGWRSDAFLKLLFILRPFLGWMALSVLLGAATIAAGIGLFGTSAYLVAYAALQPSVGVLQVAIVGVRFFGIARAVFRYLERLVSHSVNFRHLARLRVWFYRKLEPLAPAVLQEYHSADLLNRIQADIETLENFYVRAVAPPLAALFVIVGVACFAGGYDVRVAAVLVAALAAGGAGLPLIAYRLSQSSGSAVIKHRADMSAQILDTIQGMPDLLAFGRASDQLAKIREVGVRLSSSQWTSGLAGSLSNAISIALNGTTLFVVLYLMIPRVGIQIDGVGLAVIALVTIASFEAITPLLPAGQHFESSLQAGRRLFDLVERQPEVRSPQATLLAPGSFAIHISDLTFCYPGETRPALTHFDLDLPPGKHVALLGPSGSGKTTLANLLMRFWEVPSGVVDLDGHDIRRYAQEDVRAGIALIAQPAYLFSASLRDNLLVASPEASQTDLEQAIERAHLTELVAQLPMGLDTWLGERGLQLSGGERQRVLIARALLRNASLIIMDEPTANLDAATERQLLGTLREVSKGRSVLYITHRLISLEEMDEILILMNGQVHERGSHLDLLAQNGIYARWWSIHSNLL